MITYLKGDATDPKQRPAIIAHICNDEGKWGRGFVVALSKRWKEPEAAYRLMSRSKVELGYQQLVGVAPNLWVYNMVAQRGVGNGDICRVDHLALDHCLEVLKWEALERGASVHMPRIGCGLGGAKWYQIEPALRKLGDVPVYVYDL